LHKVWIFNTAAAQAQHPTAKPFKQHANPCGQSKLMIYMDFSQRRRARAVCREHAMHASISPCCEIAHGKRGSSEPAIKPQRPEIKGQHRKKKR
jgi:hypothetical protein